MRQPVTINIENDIKFNTIGWFDDDMSKKFDDVTVAYYNRDHNKEYTIFAFGVTEEGHSICCKIINYHPYFYVMIPPEYNQEQTQSFLDALSADNVLEIDSDIGHPPELKYIGYETTSSEITDIQRFYSRFYKSAIVQAECTIVEREIFWKFMNKAKFRFLKLTFISKSAMNFYYRQLLHPVDLNIIGKYKVTHKYNLFEADLEPVLRFYHDMNVKPSGWINCPAQGYNLEPVLSKCQINISCQWNRVIPLEIDSIAPLRVASFDIEADSSHGDFPIARKDCKKLANQLVIAWLRDLYILEKTEKDTLKYIHATERLAMADQFFADRIKKAVKIAGFEDVDDSIDYIYLKNYNKPDYKYTILAKCKSAEFNTLCMDIYGICNRDIKKVKADKQLKDAMKKVEFMEQDHIKAYGFINIGDLINICNNVATKCHLDNPTDLINKVIVKETMVRFVNNKLNNFFGTAVGDRVIQIGTVFWEYGSDQCFHNNIITLKNADSFNVGSKPCEVISYNYDDDNKADIQEAKVLCAWTRVIEQYDPDIIVGYNIHGFDMSFMYDRALDIIAKYDYPTIRKEDKYMLMKNSLYQGFINMGRLHDNIIQQCENARGCLINKKLSSSALGDNFLFYFNMPGRIQIDLLKVAQSSMTKLPSYKLDDVASYYISGDIEEFLPDKEYPAGDYTRYIKVSNINEIDSGNFIIINMSLTGQQLYDGEKLSIIELDKPRSRLLLSKPIPTDCMKFKPLWGLAKDDITAKDIFRMQKGTNAERGTIAKYCIQDCVLLIRLLKKLDVIPNNIGMSNVCLIPFSYIFIRGQGIKIFSLVVNETAKSGYVLPTLEKQQPDEEDVDDKTRINKLSTFNNTDVADPDIENDESGEEGDVFQLQSNFNVIKITEDSYEGAIVLTPKPNIYFDPITVLDFASLYPSEMIASDLSHDRIVEDDIWQGDEGKKRLDALGYDVLDRSYDNYKWVDPTNKNKGKVKNGVVTIRFAQTRDGTKGLIPRILQKLLTARKKKKKEKEQTDDPFKKTILEGLQLAYKLTANSLYGQIGAQTSKIYKKAIAASTTAGGRINIYKARDFVLENNPGCEVIYGDSIPGDEYVMVRIKGTQHHIKIEDLWYNELNMLDFSVNGKEHYIAKDMFKYEAYTETGWTPIKCLMRHYTRNTIMRIQLSNGSHVRVTTDHSLLLETGDVIKPTELKLGDKLLTHDIISFKSVGDNTVVNIVNIGETLDYVYDLETENHHFAAGTGNIVVHNTDSVFVKLNLTYPDGTYPIEKEAKIKRSIELGMWLQQKLKDECIFKKPHDLEYEKVYQPLILFTKKRYSGYKYEFNPAEYEKTSMGIVTKRRDNAPILKYTFNGVMDILMQECNLVKAIKFVQDTCKEIVDDKFDLNMYVISKNLSEYYKDPESIAHKVLAMRMAERDPGTKPASNERIPYVYIKINEQPGVEYLQGDRIEHINYVREHKCQVDYKVYMENQLIKPLSQIFELVVTLLPGFPHFKNPSYFVDLENFYYNKFDGDLKKTAVKISKIKREYVYKLIFVPLLDYADRKISKYATLDKWVTSDKVERPVMEIDINTGGNKPKVTANIKKNKQSTLTSFFTSK